MSFLTRTIFKTIGCWLFALALLFVFPLPALSGFAVILSVPIAVILAVLTLIALIKDKGRRGPVICAALILAVFFAALPRLIYWGALAHVYLHQRTYETTVERMLAARGSRDGERICGEKCWLMSSNGPVAFHYIHGFLNWYDIIYDPSGKVLALKSWDERKQFNMYFISAEHVTGNWYLGHFGD